MQFFRGITGAFNDIKGKKKISGAFTMLANIKTNILFIFGDSHAYSPVYNKPDYVSHYKRKYQCHNGAYCIYYELVRITFGKP